MARSLTLDLDKMIAGGRILAEEGPGLLNVLSAIWPGASKVSAFAPMLQPLATIADKFASINENDGGLRANVDTGPIGKGRMLYLRRKSSYSDADVVWAVEETTSAGTTPCVRIVDTLNLLLRCMFPDVKEGEWTVAQNRAAIDKFLDDDSQPSSDRLGDMVMFCLKNKPTKPAELPASTTVKE